MAKNRFELNKAGVIALLKSDGMKAALEAQGSAVLSRLGSGYTTHDVMSSDRVKVFVSAETKEAVNENYENNTLLKALGGKA